ncbi:MAG: hypothetical protein MJ107_05870 [Lachnospiraceae bacterium]|nr:hypothetical protein [Lachnospiraceae bacterium]
MAMGRVTAIDEGAGELEEALRRAEESLGDFSLGISKYIDNLEFDTEEFARVEERLNVINRLKSKFGKTINDILDYYDKKSEELNNLKNLDDYLLNLSGEVKRKNEEYIAAASVLTALRTKAAKEFSADLVNTLKGLNFLDVKFDVSIETDYSNVSAKGSDELEFLISTNPGEQIKPVMYVASGKEHKRKKIGIKNTNQNKENIDTLIFDEIDAGISGITAREVGKKLSDLSKKHQVISITHLAQIAAMADAHYIIAKSVLDGKTTTDIYMADNEASIDELARLLGGDINSTAARENAVELLKIAEQYKNI